jgi:hypothetical protein
MGAVFVTRLAAHILADGLTFFLAEDPSRAGKNNGAGGLGYSGLKHASL